MSTILSRCEMDNARPRGRHVRPHELRAAFRARLPPVVLIVSVGSIFLVGAVYLSLFVYHVFLC
jgi:hypothetical protein